MTALTRDAEPLAETWLRLAARGDLPALSTAMAVGKGRMQAARAVIKARPDDDRAFLDALVAGLADPRPPVRYECAHALDTFGDAACRGPLAALIDDAVPRVRWMAMHALSCHACGEGLGEVGDAIGHRVAAAALADDSVQVRRQATIALGLGGWPGAPAALRRVLAEATDAKVRRNAAWALKALARDQAA